jgi:hypothetical protein
MGQRHQIFIKVDNPVNRGGNDEVKKELRKIFGRGKTAVIALHHQWLYGRSALVNIISIFEKSNQDNIQYGNPFDVSCPIWDAEQYLTDLKTLLFVQTHPLFPRGIGIERMIFLNNEDFEITKDFTRGDNNDGISVIDTIDRKYCFANPYQKEAIDPDRPSISSWDTMTVKSAKEYLEVYYPSSEENGPDNNEILALFNDYELMSQSELKKLSPNSFKTIGAI